MNIAALVRNPEIIHSSLKEMGDKLVATKPLKIYVPQSYEEHGLASMAEETYILGIFAIVVDDKYLGISSALTMLRIAPSSVRVIEIEEEDYYEFSFDSGACVVDELNAIQEDTITYYVYNEFISKGRLPWFLKLDDNDQATLMDSAKHHAGIDVGNNFAAFEVVLSKTARNKDNLLQEWRYAVNTVADIKKNPPVYIPFSNATFTATNNVARLAGSHFKDNLTVALLSEVETLEPIEAHYRK